MSSNELAFNLVKHFFIIGAPFIHDGWVYVDAKDPKPTQQMIYFIGSWQREELLLMSAPLIHPT